MTRDKPPERASLLACLLAAAAALASLLTCSERPEPATHGRDAPLERGILEFARGEYPAAIASLRGSIDQHGASAEKLAYLANSYLALGKFTDAGRSVKQALAIEPDDAELHNISGAIHLAGAFARARYGDTDSAAAAFQKAILLDPRYARARFNLGLVHAYRDSTRLARDAWLAALEIDTTLALAHKKLGLMYREEGRLDSALAHFRRAVDKQSDDAESLFHAGFLLRISGRYDEALATLERAAGLNPFSPQVQFNLANVYMRLGRRQEGQQAFRRSELLRRHDRGIDSHLWMPAGGGVVIGPATARYNIALNHALRGEYDRAILEFRNTIAIDPELAKAYIGLGIMLAWTDRLQEAAECFLEVVEMDPADAVSHMRLGAVYLKLGDYELSRSALLRALELDQALPEAAFSLGLLEARLGNADQAIARFNRAAELRPDYPEAFLNLGVLQMKRGQVEGAVKYYSRAVDLDPANHRGHLYLSDAYARLDSVEKSRHHREQADKLSERKEGAAPSGEAR